MSEQRTNPTPLSPDDEGCRRPADLLSDREFIWSVLANSAEAIKVLDLEGRIQFISAGALRALEIADADPLLGTPWLAYWRNDGYAQARAAFEAAKAGTTASFEASRRTGKGKRTWWHVTVAPIRGGGGEPSRLVTIARDVTDRRRADPSHAAARQELHHRVKNTLAMAMAITSQSLARAATLAEGRQAVEQRLMALAEFHNVLYEGGADSASLRQIVERAIAPYDSAPSRYSVEGEDIPLSAQAALAVGMAFHELCTNAVKHGTLSDKSGHVEISWRINEATRRVHFTWRERGRPDVWAPLRPGFGMRIIEASFRDQLGGRVAVSLEPSGLTCALEAPLSALHGTSTAKSTD